MKKIIPFKKDIIFKTHLAEVTSISLEHSLHMEKDNLIDGEFLISGEYKISDTSTNTEIFNFNIPFDIHMDERYDLTDANVDIYDFYYEIVNDNILAVHIEVSVNNFKEKPVLQEVEREVINLKQELEKEIKEETIVSKEVREEEKQNENSSVRESTETSIVNNEISESLESVEAVSKINSIFPDTADNKETYATYKVYIVRESDSIEMILDNYHITKEMLEQYNDLKELKIGDKLIIPQV